MTTHNDLIAPGEQLPAASPLLCCRNGIFYYLGYPLPLGGRERALLSLLISPADGGMSGAVLAARTGISIKNISTVVKNINRKATRIGGRDLIGSGRGCGYHIADLF